MGLCPLIACNWGNRGIDLTASALLGSWDPGGRKRTALGAGGQAGEACGSDAGPVATWAQDGLSEVAQFSRPSARESGSVTGVPDPASSPTHRASRPLALGKNPLTSELAPPSSWKKIKVSSGGGSPLIQVLQSVLKTRGSDKVLMDQKVSRLAS